MTVSSLFMLAGIDRNFRQREKKKEQTRQQEAEQSWHARRKQVYDEIRCFEIKNVLDSSHDRVAKTESTGVQRNATSPCHSSRQLLIPLSCSSHSQLRGSRILMPWSSFQRSPCHGFKFFDDYSSCAASSSSPRMAGRRTFVNRKVVTRGGSGLDSVREVRTAMMSRVLGEKEKDFYKQRRRVVMPRNSRRRRQKRTRLQSTMIESIFMQPQPTSVQKSNTEMRPYRYDPILEGCYKLYLANVEKQSGYSKEMAFFLPQPEKNPDTEVSARDGGQQPTPWPTAQTGVGGAAAVKYQLQPPKGTKQHNLWMCYNISKAFAEALRMEKTTGVVSNSARFVSPLLVSSFTKDAFIYCDKLSVRRFPRHLVEYMRRLRTACYKTKPTTFWKSREFGTSRVVKRRRRWRVGEESSEGKFDGSETSERTLERTLTSVGNKRLTLKKQMKYSRCYPIEVYSDMATKPTMRCVCQDIRQFENALLKNTFQVGNN